MPPLISRLIDPFPSSTVELTTEKFEISSALFGCSTVNILLSDKQPLSSITFIEYSPADKLYIL